MAEIAYQTVIPGKRHFHCDKLHGLLDTKACADRWLIAAKSMEERFFTCRRCPIGYRHHAEHYSNPVERLISRSSICIRCSKPTARLVLGEICVSCYNRAREHKIGVNSRGTAPIKYLPPIPRMVGVVDDEGREAWTMIEGLGIGESMARAARSGHRLHDRAPGLTKWNTERQTFEYTDYRGRTLVNIETDGRIEFFPVDSLRPGEEPAPVRMPLFSWTPSQAITWLTISGDADDLHSDWRQLDFACAGCMRGVLHARKSRGEVICRCSAGCGD